jgi:hypothetical protein
MKRKIKIVHVLPDSAFEIVAPQPGLTFYELTTLDGMSSDHNHWRWSPGAQRVLRTQLRDVVIAGAKECQEGRGVVAVRLIKDGIPVAFGVFDVQPRPFAPGWFIQRRTAIDSFSQAGAPIADL